MNRRMVLPTLVSVVLVVLVVLPGPLLAQEQSAVLPVTAADDSAALLTDDQISQLLAPVALYPDPLLAVLLPASTYPDDLAAAALWITSHPNADDAAINAQPWDASVKALAHYPEVLQEMAQNPEWLQALGFAVVNQNDQVMQAIQGLRAKAMQAQSLQTTPEQQVIVLQGVIEILPASPQVIYVPTYDPVVVYVQRRPLTFVRRYGVGIWLDRCFDWDRRVVYIGDGWHGGWDYRDRRWVHVQRPRTARPVVRVWSHDVAKPRPTLPRRLLVVNAPRRDEHTRLVLPAPVAHPPRVATRPPTLWVQEKQAGDRGRKSLASPAPRPAVLGPRPAARVQQATTPAPAAHVFTPSPWRTSVLTPAPAGHAPDHKPAPVARPGSDDHSKTPALAARTVSGRPAPVARPGGDDHSKAPAPGARTFAGRDSSAAAPAPFVPTRGDAAHADSDRGRSSLGGAPGPQQSAGPQPAGDSRGSRGGSSRR